MRFASLLIVCLASSLAYAQPKPDPQNPISSSLRMSFERVKKFLAGAAEKMPENDYSFQPTPEVRSFAQLIGHVADANYMFCSAAKGEKSPKSASVEKTVSGKAALVKALDEALAYCDAAYAGLTDAMLTKPTQLFGHEMPRFAAFDINVAHDNEHYGNIVTYLRLKKIVPPSSEAKK